MARKLRIAWLAVWLSFAILAAMRMQIQLGIWIAPHWLLALLCVVTAFIPYLPWLRNFSLRTLLIATTLVAAVLGVFVLSM